MTEDELKTLLPQELKGLSSNFDATDYTNACNKASQETGWAFPVSDDFKIFWITERAKRHLLDFLSNQSSGKFKIDQINLQQPFEHLEKKIKRMDDAFEKAKEDRPDMFADVDAYKMFGTVVGPGFEYDSVGKDVTYEEENSDDYWL